MKKFFCETEKMFKSRQDLALAKKLISGKKLWRIYAIEMKGSAQNGYTMGQADHFTVDAYCEEMAIGIFKINGHMNWFVTDVKEETIIN